MGPVDPQYMVVLIIDTTIYGIPIRGNWHGICMSLFRQFIDNSMVWILTIQWFGCVNSLSI